jgi:predicted benzoate:H+ symporter BenE
MVRVNIVTKVTSVLWLELTWLPRLPVFLRFVLPQYVLMVVSLVTKISSLSVVSVTMVSKVSSVLVVNFTLVTGLNNCLGVTLVTKVSR